MSTTPESSTYNAGGMSFVATIVIHEAITKLDALSMIAKVCGERRGGEVLSTDLLGRGERPTRSPAVAIRPSDPVVAQPDPRRAQLQLRQPPHDVRVAPSPPGQRIGIDRRDRREFLGRERSKREKLEASS
jgi:hypothetical protein